MSQVSYGTITIVDTNDIESIIIEYAQNQSSSDPPESGWSTTRPTWKQNYFIWQRTRIHKSGTTADKDSFGAAVCLTGSTGATGSTGQSLSTTKTQYTHVASNVTITTSNHTSYSWTDNVPEYDSTKPVYWGRITNTYINPAKTEYIIYKDNGLTEAIANSVEANANASDALDKANESNSIATHANENAQGALSISRATQQHFWFNSTTSGSIEAGAYITDTPIDTFKNGKSGGYLLARSDGLELGRGTNKFMTLSATTLNFYRPGTTTIDATLASNGLQITNGSIVLGTTSGTAAGNVTLSNVDFTRAINGISRSNLRFAIGKNFGVKNDGTLYGTNVDINGRITAIAGLIGGWNIGTDTNKSLYYGNQVPGATITNLVISKGSVENTNAIAGSELNKTWFLTAGRQFGVDTNGILYASGANIQGKITVTSGSNVYTKTEADAAYDAKGAAQTAVDGIEIGGRNLLIGTPNFHLTNGSVLDTKTNFLLYVWTTPGKTYSGYKSIMPAKVYSSPGHITETFVAQNDSLSYFCIKHNGTKHDYNVFFDAPTEAVKAGETYTLSFDIVGANPSVENGLDVKNFKLERGNRATDWTPAPEDVEAYTDTQVSAAKAEIKVTTDGISTEVSKKVGSSEIISKINQSAEAIKIQASKIEIDGTATFNAIKSNVENTVNTAVNDIEIGGRNLVEKSNNGNIYTWMQNKGAFTKTVDDLGATFTITTLPEANSWGAFVDNGTANVVEKIEAGAEYRVSFDLRTSVAISNLLIAASVRKTNGTEPFTTGTTISLNTTADTWHHIVASTTAVATLPDVDDQRLYISMPKLKEQLGSFSIKNVKLEKGNKATDWTPAPEDIEVDLTNTANDLEQRMSATEGTVSTLSGTIDEQKDNIDDLKTKTDANSNNISTNAKAISMIQGEQTEIHNSISQVTSTTYELDTRIADIEKGVVIDPNEPSVSVVSQNGAVKVTDEKVMIKGAGNTVSWADEESFNAKRLVSSDIRPRYITFANNGQVTTTGSFALIGRSNGHMSIIRTLT
jgi:hypothetical protein